MNLVTGLGNIGAKYTFTRHNAGFMVVDSLVAIIGATIDLGLLWDIAETFNGLMAIPNLIALFLLSGTVIQLVKDYFEKKQVKN